MVTQFAKRRGVKVISIVRQAQESLNLKALGAAEVIELSKLSKSAGERIVEITDNQGLHGVVDSVGGPVAGELIRSLAMNGQAVIYGGYSAETFQLHNFDILLRNVSIKPHIFRYFFVPPQEEDAKLLQTIAKASAGPDFHVPVGGMHALDDFRSAIHTSIHQPERGKRFFRMHS
ncbi:zinc-binding dehydrogenase [Paenibacillus sp. P25]|nr:zinc-binding dehydrogenase [Paenibacillus sp. P25]